MLANKNRNWIPFTLRKKTNKKDLSISIVKFAYTEQREEAFT